MNLTTENGKADKTGPSAIVDDENVSVESQFKHTSGKSHANDVFMDQGPEISKRKVQGQESHETLHMHDRTHEQGHQISSIISDTVKNTPEHRVTLLKMNEAPEEDIYSDILSNISDTSIEQEADNNSYKGVEQSLISQGPDILDYHGQKLQVRSGISDRRSLPTDFDLQVRSGISDARYVTTELDYQEEGVKICLWVDRVTSRCCMLPFVSTMTMSHHVKTDHIEGDLGNQRQVCYWAHCKRRSKPLRQRKVKICNQHLPLLPSLA